MNMYGNKLRTYHFFHVLLDKKMGRHESVVPIHPVEDFTETDAKVILFKVCHLFTHFLPLKLYFWKDLT